MQDRLDQEHHASFYVIPRSKPEIYEYLSRDADTAFISMCILIYYYYGVYIYVYIWD